MRMKPLFLAALVVSTGGTTRVDRPLEAMLPVPAGVFTMGASAEAQHAALNMCKELIGARLQQACHADIFASEGPAAEVYLSAYSIDRVEVTVAAYRRCVQAGACSPAPLLQPDARFVGASLPVTSVTWDEAGAYCGWRGARLPTEAEWERAARGTDKRTWPWGNTPRTDVANHGRFITPDEPNAPQILRLKPDESDGHAFLAPVGSYRDGASPVGALDMSGNAAEWTADVYHEEPPQRSGTVNPQGPPSGSLRTVRGGSWRHPMLFLRTTARDSMPPDTRSPEIGFRCAK
jgi:formylglycine-generating enzyme